MRNRTIQFRVTGQELLDIEKAAQAAGIGPGPFARHAVLSGIDATRATAQLVALDAKIDALREAVEVLAGVVAEEAQKGTDEALNTAVEQRIKPMLTRAVASLRDAIAHGGNS